jgi:catechol 2,3-dioxygenase-like lactoylglutathione lyase family enzyme
MLTTPHHFGITVTNAKESRRFYHRVLRFPLLGMTVNKGARHDTMYRLENAVNEVSWFQVQDQGLELFHLPRHPARDADPAPFARPGWRYAAFTVRGFDDYVERLEQKGAAPRTAETPEGRCALVRDPDGAALVFFEDTSDTSLSLFDFTDGIGAITGIREAGLVVADLEPYLRFFDAAGLLKRDAPPTHGFLHEMFDYPGEIVSEAFGCIRVIHLPGEALEPPAHMFPRPAQERIDYYPDTGIKHICYYCEDIRGFHGRAAAAGIHFLFEPVRITGGARMAYFSDPEGHMIEAMQVPGAARSIAALGGRVRQSQMDAFSFIKRRIL